jgi:phosphatidylinositol alpha-1,6-mannosyltransferase
LPLPVKSALPPSRLLVISELFLPTKGGTTVWYDAVYRRMGGKGVHIVTADVPDAEEIDRHHPNSIHRIGLKRVWWLKPESLGMYLKMLGKSLHLALRQRFDAVHGVRALPEGLVAWIMARLLRKPLVVYCHGEELTTWGRGRKFRTMLWVYRHADANIANSEYTLEEMVRLGVRRETITLIYPGVDTERFRPGLPCDDLKPSIGLEAGQRLILSVGRLVRRKGFDQVIRALPELLKQGIDVHYALIGIGEDWDYLASLAQELGMAERLHLLGHVSPEDLPRWYNACDVFIMANREINGDTEGFGMVFLEAAACAKPAIAGDAGGTGAAVVDGVTGYRVDGNRTEGIVQALARVLGDPDLSGEMGRAGYDRALAEFSWDQVALKTRCLVSNDDE